MKRSKRNTNVGLRGAVLLVATIATLASGCGSDGDGGTEATDFDGFWLMNSITMDLGAGTTTVTRGGMPIGLIGDAVFTSSSADAGALDIRFAVIDNNIMGADPIEFLGSITVESDRWVIENPNDPMDPMDDSTTVFTTDLDGEELTLTADLTDPRNDTDDGPDEIVMTRRAPWDSDLVGSWSYVLVDGVDPGACENHAVGESRYSEISVTMDGRWWLEQEGYTYNFPVTTDCTGAMGTTPHWTNGVQWIAEVEDGTVRWYTYGDNGQGGGPEGFYAEWTFVANGNDIDFTKVDCQPTSYCSTAPDSLRWGPMAAP